jgi:hypothetical protein
MAKPEQHRRVGDLLVMDKSLQKSAVRGADEENVKALRKTSGYLLGDEKEADRSHLVGPQQQIVSEELLEDWVVVECPSPEERRLVPFMDNDEDNESLGTVAKTAALGGAAGLLFIGPMTGAVIAAGTVSACADPGSLSAAARDAVRWVRRSSPHSVAECGQAYGMLADRTKTLLGQVRELPNNFSPSLALACSSLSGSALSEKDALIERLKSELEASSRDSAEDKERMEELQQREQQWRDQKMRLTSQLDSAEQACAEEQQRHHRKLQAANLAKDEEVSRLRNELETTEQTWHEDNRRLTRAIEQHRRERNEEEKRLTSELADARKDRDCELARLQEALAEAEKAQLAEMEAKERTEYELDAARRQADQESELKRCCVCFENERCIIFMPCRHVCCCSSCARSIDKCPIDREVIQQKINFINA